MKRINTKKLLFIPLLISLVGCEAASSDISESSEEPIAISLSSPKTSIKMGQYLDSSLSISPANLDDLVISYASSNEEVATVSEKGVVYGVNEGTTTITASVESPTQGVLTDSFDLDVEYAYVAPKVELKEHYFDVQDNNLSNTQSENER